MKALVLLAASAALMMGQTAKVAGPVKAEVPKSERDLTETETLKFQLLQAKIELLQKDYKISEFQDKLKPLADEQRAIAAKACESIGVPADKLETDCSLNLGGIGPDGKATPARVWAKPPEKKK